MNGNNDETQDDISVRLTVLKLACGLKLDPTETVSAARMFADFVLGFDAATHVASVMVAKTAPK